MNEHEQRLSDLEIKHATHVATTEERFKTIFIEMGKACATMTEQTRELARLNTNIETDRLTAANASQIIKAETQDIRARLCPNAGLCEKLEPVVDDHAKRFQKQEGAAAVITTFFIGAGSLGGIISVVAWIISAIKGNPQPPH